MADYYVEKLAERNPEALTFNDDKNGDPLFHNLLQYLVLERLCTLYAGSWQVEVQRYPMGVNSQRVWGPRGEEPLQSRYTWKDIQGVSAGNPFIKTEPLMGKTLCVPPDTKLHIQTPMNPQSGVCKSGISFSNDFADLHILVTSLSWRRGLMTFKPLLIGPPGNEMNFVAFDFVMSISADYKAFRSGYPAMPQYKSWANQIANELQEDFGVKGKIQRAKDELLFLHLQTQQGARQVR